jgi:hypothetical protein
MEPSPEAILAAAMQLPEEDRFALASRLLQSMPSGGAALSVEAPGLVEELDRRLGDRVDAVSWSQLRRT